MDKYRILIIDDDSLFLFLTRESLKHLEEIKELQTVENASSAFECLNTWKKDPEMLPQLIFVDYNLDEMSGAEFARLYENRYSFLSSRLYILTSSINKKEMETALNLSIVAGILPKPINKESILKIMTQKEVGTGQG